MTGSRSQTRVSEIGRTPSRQAFPPDRGHVPNFAGGVGQYPLQRVFEPTVNDSLRRDGLSLAELASFQKEHAIAAPGKMIEQPQSGGTATKDQYVKLHGFARGQSEDGGTVPEFRAGIAKKDDESNREWAQIPVAAF
jgi:hypothetical protein